MKRKTEIQLSSDEKRKPIESQIDEDLKNVEFESHLKSSFAPISNPDITTLILGSLPGDKSLELNEYYGHPRNRFWKTIAAITNNEEPTSYEDKKALLLKSKIGLWDIAHKAIRKGSLDSAMQNEQPNDIPNFITAHGNLKTIAFNGKKSQALFDKYFERNEGIKYLCLPSTSPANAGFSFETICKIWQQLLSD